MVDDQTMFDSRLGGIAGEVVLLWGKGSLWNGDEETLWRDLAVAGGTPGGIVIHHEGRQGGNRWGSRPLYKRVTSDRDLLPGAAVNLTSNLHPRPHSRLSPVSVVHQARSRPKSLPTSLVYPSPDPSDDNVRTLSSAPVAAVNSRYRTEIPFPLLPSGLYPTPLYTGVLALLQNTSVIPERLRGTFITSSSTFLSF